MNYNTNTSTFVKWCHGVQDSIRLSQVIEMFYSYDFSYDDAERIVPDAFSHLLEEIHRLETELGHLPQKWKVLWDKLELPTTDSLTVSYLCFIV